jgi:transposase
MAKALLTDELWEVIEPLLCPTSLHKAQGWQGPRVSDKRAALSAILFVLKSGILSEMLCPRADGLLRASGMTSFCGASLWKEWHEAGVVGGSVCSSGRCWTLLRQAGRDRLGARASLGSASVPAKWGPKDRPEPHG